ncbi:hypothetical protein [Psychromonas aquatilis]|uniref:Sulfatase-like protein n=1 Tax=Psychromonas aquatilis TaxID=2005072 RepID=A0ABU9GUB6_9GAMM
MNPKTIDLIRDLSVSYENKDLNIAFDLMEIAYKARPSGPFIKKKFLEYKKALENPAPIEQHAKLKNLVESGEVAIIPIGLRCYTSKMIKNKLGIQQASLPFNSGFFSPDAVASVFENPHINLAFDNELTQTVCIKTERNMDTTYGLGVKFESSTYEHINSIAINKNVNSINKYLDSTFGYYTLDKTHNFVLAHYNWHPLSDPIKSNGVTNPEQNLKKINETLNKRILRMLDMCNKAKHILFIFGDHQNYKYLQIDNKHYFLNDFDRLNKICSKKYDSKFSIISNINNVDIDQILNVLK